MSGGLFVDTEGMSSRGNDTIREGENLQVQISKLQSSVSDLMTIWHGPAANAFNDSVTSQLDSLGEFKKLIDDFGQKIVTGSREYSDTENENASIAGKMF